MHPSQISYPKTTLDMSIVTSTVTCQVTHQVTGYLPLFAHHLTFLPVSMFSMLCWSRKTLKIPFNKRKSDVRCAHCPTVHWYELLCRVPGNFCSALPNPSALLFLSSLVACSCFFPSVFQWSEHQSALQCRGFLFRLQFLWSKTPSFCSQGLCLHTQQLVKCINNGNKLDSNYQYCSGTRIGK